MLISKIILKRRLNTISNCDKIYVLNDGIISESGNHRSLLENKNNIYYELFKRYNNEINF